MCVSANQHALLVEVVVMMEMVGSRGEYECGITVGAVEGLIAERAVDVPCSFYRCYVLSLGLCHISCFRERSSRDIEVPVVSSNTLGGGIHTE